MKNIHYFKLLLISSFLFSLITFSSCNKEDENNPISTSGETIFSLDFKVYKNQQNKIYISVLFGAVESESIPLITLNGEPMNMLDIEEGFMFFEQKIDFIDVVNYSVSSNGNITSGSIQIPQSMSDSIKCNGHTIWDYDSFSNTEIPKAANYELKWQAIECDFQEISLKSYLGTDLYLNTLSKNESSYIIDTNTFQGNNLMFILKTAFGNKLTTGSTPNVSGDYGKGFVTSSTKIRYGAKIRTNRLFLKTKENAIIDSEQDYLDFTKNCKAYFSK